LTSLEGLPDGLTFGNYGKTFNFLALEYGAKYVSIESFVARWLLYSSTA